MLRVYATLTCMCVSAIRLHGQFDDLGFWFDLEPWVGRLFFSLLKGSSWNGMAISISYIYIYISLNDLSLSKWILSSSWNDLSLSLSLEETSNNVSSGFKQPLTRIPPTYMLFVRAWLHHNTLITLAHVMLKFSWYPIRFHKMQSLTLFVPSLYLCVSQYNLCVCCRIFVASGPMPKTRATDCCADLIVGANTRKRFWRANPLVRRCVYHEKYSLDIYII